MTSSTATTTDTRPLLFEATKCEASFIEGYASALGITPDDAFTRFVRDAMRCGHTFEHPEEKEARPA